MIKQPFGAVASFAGAEIMFPFPATAVHFKVESRSDSWVKKNVLLFLSVIIKLMGKVKKLPKS